MVKGRVIAHRKARFGGAGRGGFQSTAAEEDKSAELTGVPPLCCGGTASETLSVVAAGNSEVADGHAGAHHSKGEEAESAGIKCEDEGPDPVVTAVASSTQVFTAQEISGGGSGSKVIGGAIYPSKGEGRAAEIKLTRQPSPPTPTSPIEVIGQVSFHFQSHW